MSLAHVEKMAQVGLETKKERGKLIQLLAERADELSGRIALATARIADLEALRQEIPDDADVPKLLVATVKSLDTNTSSMEATLDLMEALELDTKVYRAQLVGATSDYQRGIDRYRSGCRPGGPRYRKDYILACGRWAATIF